MKRKNKTNKNKSKIVNMNSLSSSKFKISSRLRVLLIVIFCIFLLLLFRIGWLQFINGSYLKEQAYNQQSINQIISPKRGNIYDSTNKALAISAQVDTVTINPQKIKTPNDEETIILKEKIAKALSDIFSLDYEETLTKVNSNSAVETIVKKVQQEKIDELKTWMDENNISVGINIDEDTKRYYPYNNLASNVVGFCGEDNQGLSGVEYRWNSVLTGTAGKIVSSKDASQTEIPNAEESYIAAENGSDITLTIDLNIQTIVEKYLKQAVEDNKCSRGGNVIVMNPSNGDILGMASYPDYNLNTPFTPNEYLKEKYNWNKLDDNKKKELLQEMWNIRSISDTYEPGSTFKVINSAIGIEEDIVDPDTSGEFYCKGYEDIEGTKIKCWRTNPHGSQSLRQSLMNSCNPAFMQLGKKIGATTLYKYYKAFGLFDKTGGALSGEYPSIFHKLDTVGPVELATMSFGQRFTITPLQMITAVSAIANDGVLMQPRIVKETKNTDTNAVTTIDPVEVRQVVSKETADQVKSMMESVVTEGTGRHAAVTGYSIGGKTGTSEPIAKNASEGYVASYVAISPIENTEVVLLLTLFDPQGNSYQGGQVAGPVVSQMLSEILPYLGIPSEDTKAESSKKSQISVPDVRQKTVTEAKKVLQEAGFTVKVSVSGDQNSLLVTDQVPKPGAQLSKDSIIVLYSEENDVRTSVTVPDLKGMSASQATNALHAKNLNISIQGMGNVISQDYAQGEKTEEGTVVEVTLKKTLTDAH